MIAEVAQEIAFSLPFEAYCNLYSRTCIRDHNKILSQSLLSC